MNTVSYSSVLELVAQLATGDAELDTSDQAVINAFINLRARQYWRRYPFPELCPTERRWFRAAWDSTKTYGAGTLEAGVEVYFGEANKYYQSIKAGNLNNPPAFGYGNGSWLINSDWWAESQSQYSDPDWKALSSYSKGTAVRRPSNGRWYVCHTAHVSGSSFDETKFGVLTEFVQSIAPSQDGFNPIGDVLEVTVSNPKICPTSQRLKHHQHPEGWVVFHPFLTEVWVKYRKLPSVYVGTPHDPLQAYSKGKIVFWGQDYYLATANVSAGVTPPTTPWEIIPFPAVLLNPVVLHAYADYLKADGSSDKSNTFESLARSAFDEEVDNILRQQGGHSTLNVRVS